MNIAACYIATGKEEEAKATVEKILKLNPNITVERFIKGTPMKDTALLKVWAEQLRLAGLPSKDESFKEGTPSPDKY